MGPRQLTRLLLTVLAVLVVAVVAVVAVPGRGADDGELDPGPDTSVPAARQTGPGTAAVGDVAEGFEVREARALAVALSDFGLLATTLADHEALVEGRSGLDEAAAAIAEVERRNAAAPSVVRRGVADLAADVGRRWLAVRPVALSEATAEDGVLLVQALGREAGVRAAELAALLDTMAGGDPGVTAALEEQLSRPWPVDDRVGADTPV